MICETNNHCLFALFSQLNHTLVKYKGKRGFGTPGFIPCAVSYSMADGSHFLG